MIEEAFQLNNREKRNALWNGYTAASRRKMRLR
jgi:hypothetical protein